MKKNNKIKVVKTKKEKTEKKQKKERNNMIKIIFCVNEKYDIMALVKNIVLPLGGGFLIGFLTSGTMDNYNALKKPSFSPPNYVFPIAWSILYILMGIAAYRIYMNNKTGKKDNNAYLFYLIQLSLNFLWSIIFFNFRLYGMAFILIIILLILIIITAVKFFRVDKISGVLMIPYILWVSFASVLTYFIYVLNEM